jgi:hypothetical protein
MPILLDMPDGDREPAHGARVASPVQPVEQAIRARRGEQFAEVVAARYLDRVFGHDQHHAAAPSCTSPNIHSESLGEGGRR